MRDPKDAHLARNHSLENLPSKHQVFAGYRGGCDIWRTPYVFGALFLFNFVLKFASCGKFAHRPDISETLKERYFSELDEYWNRKLPDQQLCNVVHWGMHVNTVVTVCHAIALHQGSPVIMSGLTMPGNGLKKMHINAFFEKAALRCCHFCTLVTTAKCIRVPFTLPCTVEKLC